MCFFLVEGFHHTRSKGKYIVRMAVFAVISWLPFFMFRYRSNVLIQKADGYIAERQEFFTTHSVLFTFTLCLLILAVLHSDKKYDWAKPFLIGFFVLLTYWGDWAFTAPAWVIAFDAFRNGGLKKQMAAFAVTSAVMLPVTTVFVQGASLSSGLYRFGVLLAIFPLAFYSGERAGGKQTKKAAAAFNKWAFYVFYPAHMFVLLFIKYGFQIFRLSVFS
jgi:hypothetical protein